MDDSRVHLLIIGGGPAGTQAATTAAMKGARVTIVEKDIVGGAAHLWDCSPSKTMAASALRHTSVRNAAKLGLVNDPGQVDPVGLSRRINEITSDINRNWVDLLGSQQVEMIEGVGRFLSANEAVVETADRKRRPHGAGASRPRSLVGYARRHLSAAQRQTAPAVRPGAVRAA